MSPPARFEAPLERSQTFTNPTIRRRRGSLTERTFRDLHPTKQQAVAPEQVLSSCRTTTRRPSLCDLPVLSFSLESRPQPSQMCLRIDTNGERGQVIRSRCSIDGECGCSKQCHPAATFLDVGWIEIDGRPTRQQQDTVVGKERLPS